MTTPLLRTSERKDWRTCPWKWEQLWLKSMRPIHAPTWSWFGTAWHTAMEVRYPVGRRRGSVSACQDAFRAAVGAHRGRVYGELDEAGDQEITDAMQLGLTMLESYCEHYGPESEWEVIHTEAPFQIDVPHPTKPGKTVVVYAGTWDLLAWHRGSKEHWLWDHKTAASMPNPRYLELDDQAGSYLWVAREVLLHKGLFKKKDTIEGIIFNYAKKSMPDERPRDALGRSLNKDGSISKVQPAPRFLRHNTYRSPEQNVAQARRVIEEAHVMDLQRRGKLPIWKSPSQECSRCPLFDVCEMHERGEPWEDLLHTMYRQDDVYADHREAMARSGVQLAPKTL